MEITTCWPLALLAAPCSLLDAALRLLCRALLIRVDRDPDGARGL